MNNNNKADQHHLNINPSQLPPRPPGKNGPLLGALSSIYGSQIPRFQPHSIETPTLLAKNSPQHHQNKDSSLQWTQFFDTNKIISPYDNDEKFNIFLSGDHGPLVVLFHGAGHTSHSWSLTVQNLKHCCRILTFDMRGHGEVWQNAGSPLNMSLQQLTEDAIGIIKHVVSSLPQKPTSVVLAGHSMGGAVAANVATSGEINNLKGLIVMDVVEGTALAALNNMKSIVESIPKEFENPQEAVNWSLHSGMLRNVHSAHISIPSQLKKDSASGKWVWITDLVKTEPYWKGWYQGLSEKFLNAPGIKCLMVADLGRLDKALTIAHMQGKFQLSLVGNCGHILEEDQPEEVARIIEEYLAKFKIL